MTEREHDKALIAPLPLVLDPEQRFLQSRLARLSASTCRQDDSSQISLAVFWSELRQRLQGWKNRLEQYSPLDPELKQENNHEGLSSSSSNDDIRQSLQELKEELMQLRQHCLQQQQQQQQQQSSSRQNQEQPQEQQQWLSFVVPTELPSADWRLLHVEFTTCMQLWESTYLMLFPKGKFVFKRYRAEVARRKALGIPLEAAGRVAAPPPSSSSSFSPTTDSSSGGANKDNQNDDRAIQHVRNATVWIHSDGTVEVKAKATNDSTSIPDEAPTTKLQSAVVLLRRVENCTIQIDMALQALHMVHAQQVDLVVRNHPIASSIHITNCQDCRFELHLGCQQVRIHASQQLVFTPMCEKLRAGAILEDSTNIVFQVWKEMKGDDSRHMEVNDFNWLRAGEPSPNFRIEHVDKCDKMTPLGSENAVDPAPTGLSIDVVKPIPSVAFAVNVAEVTQPVSSNPTEMLANYVGNEKDDNDDDDEL